jgi:hypothetical protein
MPTHKDAEKGERVARAPLAKQVLSNSGLVITTGKRISQAPLAKEKAGQSKFKK